MAPTPVSVTLVLVPRFPLHALALCVDALRVANREALRTAFVWTVATEDGAPAESSAGIAVRPDLALDRIGFSPVTVVLAAYEPEAACTGKLLSWLRRQDRRGGVIGCADTGARVLARAGVLGGAQTSVHPDALEGTREDYRDGAFGDGLYRLGTGRLSSAGGIGTLDMMLAFVERHEGAALAERVARMMLHDRRSPGPATREATPPRPAHPALARCVDLMHGHLEDTLTLEQLAAGAGVPPWTIRRLFRRHLGTTPSRYYRAARLERARHLLAYSHLSVAEVAAACGFAEAASLTRAFKGRFGTLPSRARRDATGLPG